mmetsp:Transcript_22175/g.73000  ORF Transcript_22175/g.73000 Transcript_22175/m.73000 type:complete len:133 (-) Transcript_22175:14-412(-)
MHMTIRHVCLLVLSFSALFSEAATGGLIRERYRTDRSCSLSSFSQADLQPYEACSVLPLNGENKFGRILIQFGETDCQFELQQCLPNVCYVLRDFSALLPKDLNLTSLQTPSNIPINTGIFRNISVEVKQKS